MTSSPHDVPHIRLHHLDQLWFQVTGTLCNLTCHHCFIHCSPHNRAFGFLTKATIQQHFIDSVAWGVKEFYFTGGEPFLHPEMTEILCSALEFGPATVLTNGTIIKSAWLERLAQAEQTSPYGLEFRVSVDGFSPETNDPIRGVGTFERAMEGVMKFVQHGFLPIITAARNWPMEADGANFEQFVTMLRERGYDRPRVKILPTLHLGAEESRSRAYLPEERVTAAMMEGYDETHLLCSHARLVSDRGVHVCPILIDASESLMGQRLSEADRPFPLGAGACFTCYQFGAICSNPASALHEGQQVARAPL